VEPDERATVRRAKRGDVGHRTRPASSPVRC
jgi:hypothetical protein